METIIKVSPSELTGELLEKIKKYISGKTNIDVTISIKEFDLSYEKELSNSLEDAEANRNLISFTMEDFIAYSPSKKGK